MANHDDGRVACPDQEITIRHYYPGGARHIPYSAIREVRRVPLGWMGKMRIYGSNDFIHWFNFDLGRPGKDTAFAIHLDGRVRPMITPDDPDRVAEVLTAHGVNVTSSHENGIY